MHEILIYSHFYMQKQQNFDAQTSLVLHKQMMSIYSKKLKDPLHHCGKIFLHAKRNIFDDGLKKAVILEVQWFEMLVILLHQNK